MSRISTRLAIVCLALVSLALATVFAQTPPAGQPPPAARPTPPRKIPPRPTAVHVVVRDQSGTLLDGARVRITGSPESITDKTGAISFPPLKDGSYRIRVDREGFITLEHEFVVRNGQPATVDLVLNAAPAPLPPPPPPPPPPEPPAPSVPESEGGPPVILSIPAFLDKNFIGRDPLKESVLACTAHSTVRLLQMRDALAEHKHADLDEVIYVVAGEGAIRARGESTPIVAGALTIVPRGVPHAVERRGKNPLILLSTLSGAPCAASRNPR